VIFLFSFVRTKEKGNKKEKAPAPVPELKNGGIS
jgi:hypothetical protein